MHTYAHTCEIVFLGRIVRSRGMEFYRVLEYSYHLCICVNVSAVEISLDRARQNLIMQKPEVGTHSHYVLYCPHGSSETIWQQSAL